MRNVLLDTSAFVALLDNSENNHQIRCHTRCPRIFVVLPPDTKISATKKESEDSIEEAGEFITAIEQAIDRLIGEMMLSPKFHEDNCCRIQGVLK